MDRTGLAGRWARGYRWSRAAPPHAVTMLHVTQWRLSSHPRGPPGTIPRASTPGRNGVVGAVRSGGAWTGRRPACLSSEGTKVGFGGVCGGVGSADSVRNTSDLGWRARRFQGEPVVGSSSFSQGSRRFSPSRPALALHRHLSTQTPAPGELALSTRRQRIF